MSEAPNGTNGTTRYRLADMERRLEKLEDLEPAVVSKSVKDLSEEVRSLRHAFYTFAFGVVASSIVFAFTTFALLGHH